MDISEEVRAAHKRELMSFLEDSVCVSLISFAFSSLSVFFLLLIFFTLMNNFGRKAIHG